MIIPGTDIRPSLKPYVDSTMISCFRSCPRKFWLEFVRGLRPPGLSIDLHAGACFASAIEEVTKQIFLSNRTLEEALLRALAAFEIQWGEFTIPEFKKTAKTKDNVWLAVESYFAQYPPLTDHVQPYFSNGKPTFEFTFSIPLDLPGFPVHPETGDPFIYSGRFDLLGSLHGRPVVRDEKTTGTGFYANWSEKWDLRSQFIGYTWACRQLGIDLDTVVVRGVGIMKTQIAHAEVQKIYSEALREKWLFQLGRDLTRMVAMWNEGYFDYDFADACSSYGNCIFVSSCASPNPEMWLQGFETRHWDPTKKDPTEQGAAA
jgi:hypothetical protein